MAQPPESKAPTCPLCGASLPLDFESPATTCRHCGAVLRIDERLRAAMLRYIGDASRALRAEITARWAGAFYMQNAKAAGVTVFGAVGIAISATFALVAWSIVGSFQTDLPLLYFLLLSAAWAGSLLAFARGWLIMFAVPTPEQLAAVRAAHCSSCGAISGFPAGEPISCCRYCNSNLLVPSSLAQSLLNEARSRAHASTQHEGDAWNHAVATGDKHIPLALAIVFGSIPAAVALVAFVGQTDGPAVSRGVLVLVFVLLFAIAIVVMVRANVRMRRAKDALDARVAVLAKRISASEKVAPLPPLPSRAWTHRAMSADGRAWVSDGALLIDAQLVAIPSPPQKEIPARALAELLTSGKIHDYGLTDLIERGGEVMTPTSVKLGRSYVDLLRTVEGRLGPLRLRTAHRTSPVVIEREGQVVAVLMPLA